jgi:3-oxoacyl-[acyl-carrier protein] reductase
MLRFDNKVAIVTGAGRGLGKAIAAQLAQEGAAVAICDLNQATCDETVSEIKRQGGTAIGVRADVSNPSDVQKLVEATMETFNKIDILVNNAGTLKDLLIKDMTVDDWDRVINVCLKGAFLCSKYVSPNMVKQNYGKIVNISSRAYLGNPGQANYSAAKAGIVGLTKALAKELGKYYINVNAVAPGLIETEMLRAHPKYEKIKERQSRETPIPRIGQPQDVAGAVLFLASDEASYITGDILHVTGGRFG